MWGSISLPIDVYNTASELSFFSGVTPRPVISFHGELDQQIKYLYKPVKFSLSIHDAYNSESICLLSSPFKVKSTLNDQAFLEAYGSKGFF